MRIPLWLILLLYNVFGLCRLVCIASLRAHEIVKVYITFVYMFSKLWVVVFVAKYVVFWLNVLPWHCRWNILNVINREKNRVLILPYFWTICFLPNLLCGACSIANHYYYFICTAHNFNINHGTCEKLRLMNKHSLEDRLTQNYDSDAWNAW